MMRGEHQLLFLGAAAMLGMLVAAPVLAGYGTVVSGDNPLAWYRMADATDVTGNGHDGTVVGDTVFTGISPVVDHPPSAVLDGAGDYVSVPYSDDFQFGRDTDFSIETWVKKSTVGGTKGLCNYGNTNGGYWIRFQNGDIRFLLDYGSTAAEAMTSGGSYDDDRWHHVVGVAERGVGVSLYIDGELKASGVDLGHGSVASTLDSTVGQLAGAQSVNGWLDELAVYGTVLTGAQVAAHYASGIDGTGGAYDTVVGADTPVAWYRMADASDSADSHGGTAGSGVAFGQTTIISGDTTGSADFDGTPDAIITVPDAVDLNFGVGEDFALEAWLKIDGTSLSDKAMIFNDGDTNAGYWLRLETDGTPRFLLDFGSTSLDARGSTSLLDEQWHHIVGIAHRDVGVQLYVDGVLADEDFNGGSVSSTTNDSVLQVGTQSSNYLPGGLDEFAIYDHALTAEEVATHYAAASVPEPDMLVLVLIGACAWLAAGRKR